MCECKQKIEERYLELFRDKEAKAEDHKVELEGYGFALNRETNTVEMSPYMMMNGTYLHTFKNGNKKTKKVRQAIFFNFCPFCGESLGRGTTVPE